MSRLEWEPPEHPCDMSAEEFDRVEEQVPQARARIGGAWFAVMRAADYLAELEDQERRRRGQL